MTVNEIVGRPWALLNLSDVIIIGLIAILAFQVMAIFGLGYHRWIVWRNTGSAVTAINTNPQGRF
jgi:hypothetical protein